MIAKLVPTPAVLLTRALVRAEAARLNALFLGPPGCGKRTLARAAAAALDIELARFRMREATTAHELVEFFANHGGHKGILLEGLDAASAQMRPRLERLFRERTIRIVIGSGPRSRVMELPVGWRCMLGTTSSSARWPALTRSFRYAVPVGYWSRAELQELVARGSWEAGVRARLHDEIERGGLCSPAEVRRSAHSLGAGRMPVSDVRSRRRERRVLQSVCVSGATNVGEVVELTKIALPIVRASIERLCHTRHLAVCGGQLFGLDAGYEVLGRSIG